MKLEKVYLKDIDEDLRTKLYSLTLEGDDSAMKGCLKEERNYSYGILAYENNEIVGWAMILFGDTFKNGIQENLIGFFVAPKHRRKGIATTLYHEAVRYCLELDPDGRIKIGPWDPVSRAFYRKLLPKERITESYREITIAA